MRGGKRSWSVDGDGVCVSVIRWFLEKSACMGCGIGGLLC